MMQNNQSDNRNAFNREMVAAIDLGSNSFHMIVARNLEGQLQLRDRLREMVRLAAGLDRHGNLDDAARARALECLQRFGQRLNGFAPGSIRAVGTNTLRRARCPTFLHEAEQALGHPIEIIAGREEARLIYLGVAHGLPDSEGVRLVVDIGGGSTELILGRRFEPLELESLAMGCVSFSERYFAGGKVSAKAMNKAVLAARLELQEVEAEFRQLGWEVAVGASGTVKAIGEVVRAMGWADEGVTLPALQRLASELVQVGDVYSLKLAGLKEERLPVLAGGVAVLLAIFEGLQLERLLISESALREGLLYDLLGRIRHEDVRERTIDALSERYQVDRLQAQRVVECVGDLLRQTATAWQLPDEEYVLLLNWAARLHEIGLAIAHSGYQKHGAYLLENSDMPGFSSTEQKRLAVLVRGHRRKLSNALFRDLPEAQQQGIQRLCILLRLAVLLHRSHSTVTLPTIVLQARDRELNLAFPEGWLDEHPLTMADLANERERLQSLDYQLTYG
ncbi:MAG: exopolyphosphatase [Gammaproteobacteria bacterium]